MRAPRVTTKMQRCCVSCGTCLGKQNISVDAGDVFFVRFIRVKTSEEQGLSLFSDADFLTCPLHAIALALMTQSAPCVDLFANLPVQQARAAVTLDPDTPHIDLLDNPDAFAGLVASVSSGSDSLPTIHSYVNRILDSIAKPAGVVEQLTSHSFRRGGAQHANGSAQLTARWIFERGAWNMITTNKGFNYVFNTTTEDHKVAKILSGWSATEHVALIDLNPFDTQTRDEITKVQKLLFATCQLLKTTMYNANQRVLDVLTAYLIVRYPLLKEANPADPAIKRLKACVLESGCSLPDLLAWSTYLALVQASSSQATCATKKPQPSNNPSDETEERRIIRHHASVIDHFINQAKHQNERLDKLEAKSDRVRQQPDTACSNDTNQEVSQQNKRRKKSSVTHLKTMWFTWYAQ